MNYGTYFSQVRYMNGVQMFRVDERLIEQVIKSTLFSFKKVIATYKVFIIL